MVARLLVVDDERDMCDLLVHRLGAAGHEVLAADSAAAALALVERHGMPQAAILDVDMPGTDGFALLKRLRELRPGLPALFVTVLWGGDVHARITAMGADHLAKPFTGAQLHAGVQRILAIDAPPRNGS